MSKSKPPASGKIPAPHPTRQMLDELDALMERMLALPVNELEDNPAATIDEEERRHLAATLTVLPPSVPLAKNVPPSRKKEEELELPEESGIVLERVSLPLPGKKFRKDEPIKKKPVQTAPEPEWVIPPENSEADFLPPLIVRRSEPDHVPVPEPRRRSFATWCCQPLLWMNQGFDRGTYWLGPIGRWLRGGRGRAFLGLTGLLLLGLAGAWWFRDWMGWNR